MIKKAPGEEREKRQSSPGSQFKQDPRKSVVPCDIASYTEVLGGVSGPWEVKADKVASLTRDGIFSTPRNTFWRE